MHVSPAPWCWGFFPGFRAVVKQSYSLETRYRMFRNGYNKNNKNKNKKRGGTFSRTLSRASVRGKEKSKVYSHEQNQRNQTELHKGGGGGVWNICGISINLHAGNRKGPKQWTLRVRVYPHIHSLRAMQCRLTITPYRQRPGERCVTPKKEKKRKKDLQAQKLWADPWVLIQPSRNEIRTRWLRVAKSWEVDKVLLQSS